MKFLIGGKLFITFRVRMEIIEKVAPISIKADEITASKKHRWRLGRMRRVQ